MHALFTALGLDGGPVYAFYSGLFVVLVFAGGQWASVRRHNCHEPRCWRVGRFPVEGTGYVTCRRHHPHPPGRGDIRRRYHLFIGERPGRG